MEEEEEEASPPFPFAAGGLLQRPPLNFKGSLLKSLKVGSGSKRLVSPSARAFREMSPRRGWLLVVFVTGMKMASLGQKLRKPVFFIES